MSHDISNSVASRQTNVRVEFIKKTYQHLAYAILGFIALEVLLLNSPFAEIMTRKMTGGYSWLIVLGAFMGVSWLADSWARSSASLGKQYAGLALYVVAEAIIFIPLLYIAKSIAPNVIPMAGIFTGLLFLGLSYTAFTTKKDFSFLGGMLKIGGFIALGFIGTSIVFGFNLGILFSTVMIVFASASILYSTSNILRYYRPDQYVAASLSLFASVALLFWYIISFLLHFTSGD